MCASAGFRRCIRCSAPAQAAAISPGSESACGHLPTSPGARFGPVDEPIFRSRFMWCAPIIEHSTCRLEVGCSILELGARSRG